MVMQPRPHPSGLFQVKCDNMIPAERCVVLIWPSMIEREKWLANPQLMPRVPIGAMHPLEQHGMDEIDCGFETVLEMQPAHDSKGWYHHGECPRCGQTIKLYDN